MLSSEYQGPSVKIWGSTINPISTKGGGGKILNLLLEMSYVMPKKLSFEFQSHSIKIEDFKFNVLAQRGEWKFKTH